MGCFRSASNSKEIQIVAPANTGRFQPGQSGNPKGRPAGAKSKLQNTFLTALWNDFKENGRDAISAVRAKDPGTYLRIIASLMPKEVELTIDNPLAGLSDEQLDALISLGRTAEADIAAGCGQGGGEGEASTAGEAEASRVH